MLRILNRQLVYTVSDLFFRISIENILPVCFFLDRILMNFIIPNASLSKRMSARLKDQFDDSKTFNVNLHRMAIIQQIAGFKYNRSEYAKHNVPIESIEWFKAAHLFQEHCDGFEKEHRWSVHANHFDAIIQVERCIWMGSLHIVQLSRFEKPP